MQLKLSLLCAAALFGAIVYASPTPGDNGWWRHGLGEDGHGRIHHDYPAMRKCMNIDDHAEYFSYYLGDFRSQACAYTARDCKGESINIATWEVGWVAPHDHICHKVDFLKWKDPRNNVNNKIRSVMMD
ncbi:hypothetical protein BDZ45DRAFT_770559 [Acephala macrosclerotiorum]|nr:hypothetical protein BDZ45DRAFT_770559 [Acephala macrosclerotiorum]